MELNRAAFLVTSGLLGCCLGAHAQSAAARCKELAAQQPAGMQIKSVDLIPANSGAEPTAPAPLQKQASGLREYCKVTGSVAPHSGAGGKQFSVGFEMRLPTEWNGSYLFQGGGGLDGVVTPAIGNSPISDSTAKPALARGYAVISTDSGHLGGMDASFALDQQARLDYAYAAIGKVAAAARQLIGAYYQKAPQHSLFMGCSNGGREALIAAERYPEDFDGVVAGNPGFRLSRAAVAEAWDIQALAPLAPRDARGNLQLYRALDEDSLSLVAKKLLEQCDALDGVQDGIIDAMSACTFDPSVLACKGDKTATCLSADQVTALQKIFTGAKDSKGNLLYASWPWDTGIGAPGWRMWKTGSERMAALNQLLGAPALGYYFTTPANPQLKMEEVNFDTIAAQTAETGALNDAVSTDLSSFHARHGKLIVIEGNSDPVFSANDLRVWWKSLERTNGGADQLAGFARLFIIPGMTHCGGGPALADVDPLSALETWMDADTALDALPARGGKEFPGRTRNICAFPQESRYNGTGDVQLASSFHCVTP